MLEIIRNLTLYECGSESRIVSAESSISVEDLCGTSERGSEAVLIVHNSSKRLHENQES